MKKTIALFLVIGLMVTLFAGCNQQSNTEPATSPSDTATQDTPTTAPTEAPTEEPTVPADVEDENVSDEGDANSYYIDQVYTQQIARYQTALSEQWDPSQCLDNELSELPAGYYEGNPLENVGFGFVDLDNDGSLELIIGAILNAEEDPSVFEIWTLVDGEPVMLAQGGSRNRYLLQFVEEDNMWYVVNEAANSAASSATYYMMLQEGKLEEMQGIVYDADANPQNPWFMTYDMDWDVSNDEPIDEAMADSIFQAHSAHYTAIEYFPYIYFNQN